MRICVAFHLLSVRLTSYYNIHVVPLWILFDPCKPDMKKGAAEELTRVLCISPFPVEPLNVSYFIDLNVPKNQQMLLIPYKI